MQIFIIQKFTSLFAGFDIDIAIVVFFILLSLVIGVKAGKKIKTVEDYTVANKKYSMPILTISLLATMRGGYIISDAAEIYNQGLIFFFASLGGIIAILLLIKLIIPKFDIRFYKMISSGDMIKYFYGRNAEIFSSLVAYIYLVIILSLQIMLLGYASHNFLGLDCRFGVFFCGAVLVIYSAAGGIKAVTKTDIFQLTVLILVVPLILNIPLADIGNLQQLVSQVPDQYFQLYNHPDKLSYLLLFIFVSMPFIKLQPEFIQRCLMTKNSEYLHKASYNFFLGKYVLVAMVFFISLIAIVNFPNIEPNEIMSVLISEYFPTGLKGLAIAGIILAIMSTADSCLNTSTILLTHNIVNAKNKLAWMKCNTIITGIAAILISIQNPNIISLWVVAQSFVISAVCLPVFFGLIRLKVSKSSYSLSVFLGMTAFFMIYFGFKEEKLYIAGLGSLVASLLSFIVIHLIENKGSFKHFVKKTMFCDNKEYRHKSGHKLRNFLNKYNEIEFDYVTFGVFSIINYTLPIFLWSDMRMDKNTLILRFIAVVMSVLLLLKPKMPAIINKYFHWYWNITLTFCLPFITTVLMLSECYQPICIINIGLSVILLLSLVDKVKFFIVIAVGVFLGIIYYMFVVTDIQFNFPNSYIYTIFYTLVYSTVIGLFFTRKRKIGVERKFKMVKNVSKAILREVTTPLNTLALEEQIIGISNDISTKSKKRIIGNLQYVKSNIQEVIVGFQGDFDCKKDAELFDIKEIIKKLEKDHIFGGVNHKMHIMSGSAEIYGNKFLLSIAIKNILKNAIRAISERKNGKMHLITKMKDFQLIIYIRDNGIGIAASKLDKIFDKFFTTYPEEGNVGLGLFTSKMIVEGHGGYIKCESELGEYTKFTIMLPIYSAY